MFNKLVQIALGICYGLYLAILAPTTQRQNAHESLKQHAVIPSLQEDLMLSQNLAAVVEPTTQLVVVPDMVEDPWLAELTPITTENQKTTAAIATVPSASTLLLLPPEQLDHKQTVKASSRKKTKPTQKPPLAVAQAKQAFPVGIAKMTVAQLRSLCKERNIKWRNAYGSKHLTKTEMLERLTA